MIALDIFVLHCTVTLIFHTKMGGYFFIACADGCRSCDAAGASQCDYAGGCSTGYTMTGVLQCKCKKHFKDLLFATSKQNIAC